MPKQRSVQDNNDMSDLDQEAQAPESALEEGKVFDYITGNPVKDSDKEQVRQRIARAIIHEYGIAAEDMEPDFKVKVLGKNRKLDIAIFKPGEAHTVDNLYRAVVVEKEPKLGTKGAYRMRDPEEARKEFEVLETVMAEVESCDYGLWTNGLEFFFFKKEVTRFDTKFKPIGDWPLGDDTFSVEGRSVGHLRPAKREMLLTAFRRCHNYIHGNEGMPKDAAFWQFLYLIFCKMYDEQQPNERRSFWAGAFEPFDPEGQKQIRKRILPLFEHVKNKYGELFKGNEEISLSDRALAFIVSELSRYDFGRTEVDVKGVAYQQIVGANLRGDRGAELRARGLGRRALGRTRRSRRVARGAGNRTVPRQSHIVKQPLTERETRRRQFVVRRKIWGRKTRRHGEQGFGFGGRGGLLFLSASQKEQQSQTYENAFFHGKISSKPRVFPPQPGCRFAKGGRKTAPLSAFFPAKQIGFRLRRAIGGRRFCPSNRSRSNCNRCP